MPNWTNAQLQAIHTQGKTLLVSAGAGSGKTTVLTQRVIEQIQNGASVEDFLIVTFTKASASDLKAKLYQAIGELSAAHPEDRRFRSQLYLLSGAHISTIHSFCLEIVRSNFQTLGLSPRLRMADEQESGLLAREAMETVIDAFYESEDENFLLFADTFTGTKDDGPLADTMLDLYGRLRAYTDYFGWLEQCADEMQANASGMEQGLFRTPLGSKLQGRLREWFDDLAKAAESLCLYVGQTADDPKCAENAMYWQEKTRLLSQAVRQSYQSFVRASRTLSEEKPPRMSTKGMSETAKQFYKSERDRIQKETERLLSLFASESEQGYAEQCRKTAAILRAMTLFLRRFEELYAQAKRDASVLDFSDAEHFLLHLLEQDGQPTPLCLSLRRKLKEVCIDEYQDVSPLQDRIFTLLSSGNNRFMVGDVKQSIYRFRNAYPDIFLSYKDAFPDVDKANESPCARIFLRENFRSGEKILRFVNLLFRQITANSPYEREYRGEELVFAKQTDSPMYPVTVAVATHEERSKENAREREADYIAEEILRLIESGTRETKDGPKPYRYRDIVLLFRALKGTTAPYERALRERGIPYAVTNPAPFFERPEILLVLSLLRAVDDPTDDISLAASLRSPFWDFSADELYRIRRGTPDGPLYRALQHASEQTDALAEKCRRVLAELEEWRAKANGVPCHTFLWEVYQRTGLLHFCTERERRGLLLLYESARGFSSGGYQGLFGFLSYLQSAQEKGLEPAGGTEQSDADCVTLTTIHKSKGLEYPAVFLCNCDRALFANRPKPYRLLRSQGLFFRLRDYDRLTVTDTLPNRFAALLERDAELGEELRKLYVACTRAREKLYITGTVQEKQLTLRTFNPRTPSCFLDLVLYAVGREQDDSFERIVISDEETERHTASQIERKREQPLQGFLTEGAKQAIRFVYPYRDFSVPAKVSVSELKQQFGQTPLQRVYRTDQITRAPSFLEQKAHTGAEKGTANHVFLQFCDFAFVEQNGIEAEAKRLLQKRLLTPEQGELLDFDGLRTFFDSNLYARMRQSKRLYREQRFSVRASASLLGGGETETVLLQGVIDCFFAEQDGSLTVVDYKTDRVTDGESLRRRYEAQLDCYRFAVSAMTGRSVERTAIWSFALGREV